MNAIILDRKNYQDTSIIISAIFEDGFVRKLKLPGILKSRKRNPYHLTPGALWHFILLHPNREIQIPKESTFNTNPIGELKVTIDDLEKLSVLKTLIPILHPEIKYPTLFPLLKKNLQNWPKLNSKEQEFRINKAFISFLYSEGLIHIEKSCAKCTEITMNFTPGYGTFCNDCPNRPIYEEKIPVTWFLAHLDEKKQNFYQSYPPEESKKYRTWLIQLSHG